MPGEEVDAALYQRLLNALHSTAEDDAIRNSGHVDQVMEEILTDSVSIPDNSALSLHSEAVGGKSTAEGESIEVGAGGWMPQKYGRRTTCQPFIAGPAL
jgi:hypothetical protein